MLQSECARLRGGFFGVQQRTETMHRSRRWYVRPLRHVLVRGIWRQGDKTRLANISLLSNILNPGPFKTCQSFFRFCRGHPRSLLKLATFPRSQNTFRHAQLEKSAQLYSLQQRVDQGKNRGRYRLGNEEPCIFYLKRNITLVLSLQKYLVISSCGKFVKLHINTYRLSVYP